MTKKTSQTTKFLIFLGLILLVSIVCLNAYQNFVNTPKKIFIDALNSLANDYKEFNKIEKLDYNFFDKNFDYDGKIDINITSSLISSINHDSKYYEILKYIDYLNNLKIHYNLKRDGSNLLFKINNEYNDDILDIIYYYDNSNHYVSVNNYNEEFINVNSLINQITSKFIYFKDNDYLINFIVKDFIDNLQNDYFKTDREEIEINGDIVNVNKNSLVLDKKTLTTILNQILIDLKNDQKSFTILNDIFPNFSNFEIKITDNEDDDIICLFNTYLSKNKLVKYELEFQNINSINSFDVNNLAISFWKEDRVIDILLDQKNIAKLNFFNKENGSKVDLYLNESKILTFDVDNTDIYRNIAISSGTIPNNKLSFYISEILDKNILEDYDKIETKLFFNLRLLGFNMLKLEINNTANISENKKIDISIDQIRKLEDLSFDDYENIKNILTSFFKIEK